MTAAGTLALRAAAERDVDVVARIESVSFTDPWSRSAFASLLGQRQSLFFVADWYPTPPHHESTASRVEIAGYAIAWVVADEAEVANIAVAPTLRGQRIGARLLDAVLAEVKVRGAAAVYLEVRESNVAARRLYASRRFEEVGRRKKYYRLPQEDALVLRRDLTTGASPVSGENAAVLRSQ